MTPEYYFSIANNAIEQEQWDRAVAYAATGLLALMMFVHRP